MDKIEIGEFRLIPEGTMFWSISNQTNLITSKDEIIEIKATCCGHDYVYVEPKQLLAFTHQIIGQGKDEWGLSYSKTLPYKKPKGIIYYMDIKIEKNGL